MSKRKFEEKFARHVEEPLLPHLVPELEMKKEETAISTATCRRTSSFS